MIVVFMVLVMLVIGATAAALAGRWQPEGLPDGPPMEATAPVADPRFDVVVRGYRMDQVDEELGRLREQLRSLAIAGEEPDGPGDPDPGDAR